ncbi:MAG: polymer-forming cytoskeletal protein [Deltaproteobacteria bacterium]|nr:polymer-forming cytoskeletal protein [Deltaproteobacteria bacterium]
MAITRLGKTMRLQGDVRGSSPLVVLGTVSGSVEVTADVRVEVGGTVRADIAAKSVEVAGEVVGNIRAEDRVEVFAAGRVTGDIRAPRVLIANGAVFKGNVAL